MARFTFLFSLLTFSLHTKLPPGGEARKFTIANNCSYTVWPAFSSAYNGTMFALQSQQSRIVDLPAPGWPIQIWARTGCRNSAGNFTCQTGDCGSGKLNCAGYGFPPATNLAEFHLNRYDDYDPDYYDVNLANGYNVGVAVVPQGGNGSNCAVIGCIYDIDGACPQELKVGGACQNPCNALNSSVACQPAVFSTLFGKACPRAYSYALDGTSNFSCRGSPAFTVTFCPSSPILISEFSEPLNSSASALPPAPAPALASPSFPPSRRPSGEARKFTIANNCSYTVWPAFSSAYNGTMFALQSQQSRVVDLPAPGWPIQIWARTGCRNSAGNFTCQTGDCGSGKLNCAGYGFPPATNLAEFRLNRYDDYDPDYYDVNLANGYNVGVAVVPQGGNGSNCAVIGCIYDIDGACPQELKVGGACQNPCDALNSSVACQPAVFSTLFGKACPRAYSYALDGTSNFSCGGSPAFTVTFCPSSPILISEFSEPLNSSASALSPSPALASPSFPPSWSPSDYPTKTIKLQVPTAVVIAVPTSTTILILLFLGIWILMKKKKARERHYVEMNEISTTESLQFDISTIRAATHNFSIDNKLGEGGFGVVYKGKLASGQEVAVKRLLQNSKQGVIEFKTEVVLVAKLQHKNLVKLLGFCVTSKEKILVYEFLPNSSLDRFLFDRTSSASMDWQKRLNIIVGIAKGLMYLHEDSRLKVIHRDLKTSNILLDESMNPKISDFGLAKLFGEGQTQGDTKRIVGTYGYMAPEYAITGHYSIKSDVYSFGVIVLEIISGQKNRFIGGLHGAEALLHQAWRLWNEGKALDLVDSMLKEDFSHEEVIRCYQIGLLCIQEDAIQRPRMRWILDALSRPSISLPEPTAPRFFGNPVKADQGHHAYTGTETITDLYPRD